MVVLAVEEALAAVAQMQKTRVVDLDQVLALTAADVSVEHGLAIADAIVYATAMKEGTELVSGDSGFEGLPGARVFSKP